jgi:hypothetical protein
MGMSADRLDTLLELTYIQLMRPDLHAHVCYECRCLLPCTVKQCVYRATDRERDWACFRCKTTSTSIA